VARALAWVLDLFWRLAAFILLAFVAGSLGRFGGALLMLSAFALEWLVPAFCEVYFTGATPGKKALGLQVLRDDGSPVHLGTGAHAQLPAFRGFPADAVRGRAVQHAVPSAVQAPGRSSRPAPSSCTATRSAARAS
jgi:uncharacterized RDD family membrane protein YckC